MKHYMKYMKQYETFSLNKCTNTWYDFVSTKPPSYSFIFSTRFSYIISGSDLLTIWWKIYVICRLVRSEVSHLQQLSKLTSKSIHQLCTVNTKGNNSTDNTLLSTKWTDKIREQQKVEFVTIRARSIIRPHMTMRQNMDKDIFNSQTIIPCSHTVH